MEMMQVARELVAGCREDRARDNLDRLYAPDAVSVEAVDPGQGRESRGLDAIKAKHDWWEGAMEMVKTQVSDPMPHGDDRFAVVFQSTVRSRDSGTLSEMEEVGIYTVAEGRIVREEFFYPTPGA